MVEERREEEGGEGEASREEERGGRRDSFFPLPLALTCDTPLPPNFLPTQTETGHAYDGHCLRLWFLMGGTTCPLTGCKLVSQATHQNADLTAAVAAARALAGGDDDEAEWWKPALAALPAATVRLDGRDGKRRPVSADAASCGARGAPRRRPWTACLARGGTRGSDGEGAP